MRLSKRLVAYAALAAGLAGCTAQGQTTQKVTGNQLKIYASAPPGTPADVVAAERLAFSTASHEVTRFSVKLVVLHGSASSNARTAIQDPSAIAYIGEPSPGLSAGTIGITNAQDVLQVSPTDTALELTDSTPAVSGAPGIYYESKSTYGRTFARVVPTTAAEARAQVTEMSSLGVKKVYVASDASPYGRAIASAVARDGPTSLSVVSGPPNPSSVSSSGADAVFYGGTSMHAATTFFGAVGSVKRFAPSALYSDTLASSVSGQGQLYVSSPGFLVDKLPSAARDQFLKPFQSANGHQPLPEAIFGYAAVSAVLDVLKQAGSAANQRNTVVRDFMRYRTSSSVLGSYSIDGSGNPTIAPFVFARAKGSTLTPFRSVQVPGGS